MNAIIPRPLSDAELRELRGFALNITRFDPARSEFLELAHAANTLLGIIMLVKHMEDIPHREELIRALREKGLDIERDYTYEDTRRILDRPTYP